jgi:acetylornithine deacetylase
MRLVAPGSPESFTATLDGCCGCVGGGLVGGGCCANATVTDATTGTSQRKKEVIATTILSGMLSSREAAVVAAIDQPALLADLDALIRIPSLGGQEDGAQRWMHDRLRAMGLAVDAWPIDVAELRAHPSFSMEVERTAALGIVGTFGAGDTTLILNGHVDVVPIGDPDQWTVPPWEMTIKDGRAFGRGACDMKGGLACALAAIRALQEAKVTLTGRVALHSVVAEEDGGMGTLATLARGHRGDAAISMEPTRLALAPAHAGALSFRLRVPGQATHGAVREEGVSAIEKFEIVHRALLDLEARRNARLMQPLFTGYRLPYALSIGKIAAGDWPSSVPDLLIAEGRYGLAPGEDAAGARAELETAVRHAATHDAWLSAHPPTVEWWGGQFLPASTASTDRIVTDVTSAASDVLGHAPNVEGMTYGADMRLLVNDAHIPTVLFGPGDVRVAHRPDEFVPIEDLMVVTRVLAVTAMRFCGGR